MARPRNVFALGDGPWDPNRRLETSWLLPPLAFGLLRLLISLYIFVTLFTIIGIDCSTAPTRCAAAGAEFSYFTFLTYWGLGFYFLAAAVHTLTYHSSDFLFQSTLFAGRSSRRSRANNAPERATRGTLARLPRALQAAHLALRTSAVVYPFLVTLVFWLVIYDRAAGFRSAFPRWSNVSEHGLNSAFALAEVLLSRAGAPPPLHQLWLLLVLALYLGLAYITRAVQGVYVYAFLDPSRQPHGRVAAYVLGIAVGALVAFWLSWAAHWARVWLTEERWGMRGKFAPHDWENAGNTDNNNTSNNNNNNNNNDDGGERALDGLGGRGVELPSRHGEAEEHKTRVDEYSLV